MSTSAPVSATLSSTAKPVSVVIPTYNGLSLLQKNLGSVFACVRAGDEVIIIDDAGTDETVAWLTGLFKLQPHRPATASYDQWDGCIRLQHHQISLTVLANKRNLRFGASVNRAVSIAQHPLIFLLNNDVSPFKDVLTHLLPHFDDSDVFAVGCHEIEANQGGISGGKNVLYFSKGMFAHNRAPHMTTGPTAWASGGSSVFDKAKWEALGGFDRAFYPAYWEDVDLSFRARQRGWKVLFEAKAKVHHNHESTNASVFGQAHITRMSWKSAQTFVIKHGNWLQKLQFWLWQPYYWYWWKRQNN